MVKKLPATRSRSRLVAMERLEARLAPAISWNVTFDDPGQAYSAYYDPIRETMIAAGQEWSRYLNAANANIEVAVKFEHLGIDELAHAGSETSVFFQKSGQLEIWEFSVPHEIRTGRDPNGAQRDATIAIDVADLQNTLWFDPTVNNRHDEQVPLNMFDAYTLFMHELGHCLGFQGWRDHRTGQLSGKFASRFDQFVTTEPSGLSFFGGPAAKAAYGNRPVPLTYSNLFHLGNKTLGWDYSRGDPTGTDLDGHLMSGTGLPWGARGWISALEAAILKDAGLPISLEPVNTPPTLADVDAQSLAEDEFVHVPLLVNDMNLTLGHLIITVSSNNENLLPPGEFLLSGVGANRILTIRPAANQYGSAVVTVNVSDGSLSVSDTFSVEVTSVYDMFQISELDRMFMMEDTTKTITFTVTSAEVPPSQLIVRATASNRRLFPPGSLRIEGTGEQRTLVMTPAADLGGESEVGISVDDGISRGAKGFYLLVGSENDPPTISTIPNQSLRAGDAVEVSFSIDDDETALDMIWLGAENSDSALISQTAIPSRGSGNQRTVLITTKPNVEGEAVVTIRASDGLKISSQSFQVKVSEEPFPWHNRTLLQDVDNDGHVAPNDALRIIDLLNADGAGPLPWRRKAEALPPFYDVDADNYLAPGDALAVIDYINLRLAAALDGVDSEGEPSEFLDLILGNLDQSVDQRRGKFGR
jgi:hypothetical protein